VDQKNVSSPRKKARGSAERKKTVGKKTESVNENRDGPVNVRTFSEKKKQAEKRKKRSTRSLRLEVGACA